MPIFHSIGPRLGTANISSPRRSKLLGYRIQLGHWHEKDRHCPRSKPSAKDDFVVVDVNGVHEVHLSFCECEGNGTPIQQLLRAGLFPATPTNPRTAATIRVLRHFHLSFLESASGVFEYYTGLARQTDNTGLEKSRDRYDEFLRMTKEWRNLQMLKRAGRGHDPNGITATQPGECALLCPACPQPGKNLPDDWQRCAEERRFLYALFLAIDANFRLRRKDVSSEKKDPGLADGLSFFCETDVYMTHVKKHWNDRQARSRCVAHDAVDKPDRDARGTASSGIGAVDCARHNMKRPLSVGDTQLGERYINMDFMFFRSILGSQLVQFFVYNNDLLSIDRDNRYFVFLVPKFHLPAHIEECNLRFSFNLTRFAGMTDGEAPERGWSATNHLAGSTMNMGPGSRRDALNDFFNDQNHKKIISLGKTMLKKVKEAAPRVIETKQALISLESGFESGTIKTWSDMATAWEGAAAQRPNPFPNPFESKGKGDQLPRVRRELAEEAARREATGTEDPGMIRNDMHVTELIAGGLHLEEQQRALAADISALGTHPTDRQRTAIVERASKLRRKVLAWIDIHAQFFPIAEDLHQQADNARADVAASQAEGIPGTSVTEIKLWLPSAIRGRAGGPSERDGCTTEIMTYELRMRVGEANEALALIRRLLLVRTHLLLQKDRYSREVKANTRSNTQITTLNERIRRAVAQYQAAWHALRVLGEQLQSHEWATTLKELKADDVRGMPRKHFGDPARQRGSKAASGTTEEPLVLRPEGEESRAKRSKGRAQDPLPLSWIWIQATEGRKDGESEEMDEALRIEWARTRARALRWEEELDLLEEEMRRISEFLIWRGNWWQERIALKSRPEYDAFGEGERAYALRQAAIQRGLQDAFSREWAALPAYIADARARAAAAAGGSEPERDDGVGATDAEEVDDDDVDDPVPMGPPGAVLVAELEG
ncbi:hypothetical protein HMN09_00930700 [Mycena chlorophos]|uniref:CxC2-like cysteine cluster KDZ transposase-associated domain-containing protein n=1 Tax=Mycena chlorophos TaxID=658473 RepID=A0A8H6W0G5_MYCCL|nr:hypothetical protein HMN09_00930700 [Mycena chlorophos]